MLLKAQHDREIASCYHLRSSQQNKEEIKDEREVINCQVEKKIPLENKVGVDYVVVLTGLLPYSLEN